MAGVGPDTFAGVRGRTKPYLFVGPDSYPDTPCMPYMPISWGGGLGGQLIGIYGSPMECLGKYPRHSMYAIYAYIGVV